MIEVCSLHHIRELIRTILAFCGKMPLVSAFFSVLACSRPVSRFPESNAELVDSLFPFENFPCGFPGSVQFKETIFRTSTYGTNTYRSFVSHGIAPFVLIPCSFTAYPVPQQEEVVNPKVGSREFERCCFYLYLLNTRFFFFFLYYRFVPTVSLVCKKFF